MSEGILVMPLCSCLGLLFVDVFSPVKAAMDDLKLGVLSVAGCASKDEFLCGSGECIPWKQLCDGLPHCKDGSDEGIDCGKSGGGSQAYVGDSVRNINKAKHRDKNSATPFFKTSKHLSISQVLKWGVQG